MEVERPRPGPLHLTTAGRFIKVAAKFNRFGWIVCEVGSVHVVQIRPVFCPEFYETVTIVYKS